MAKIKMVRESDKSGDVVFRIYVDDEHIESAYSEEVANVKYSRIKQSLASPKTDPVIIKEEEI